MLYIYFKLSYLYLREFLIRLILTIKRLTATNKENPKTKQKTNLNEAKENVNVNKLKEFKNVYVRGIRFIYKYNVYVHIYMSAFRFLIPMLTISYQMEFKNNYTNEEQQTE